MPHDPRFLDLVQSSKNEIKELTIGDVKKKQDQSESFHLVDCREDSEWDKDYILGAIHIGKGVIERDIVAKIPNLDEEIIIYCGGGFRSALAAEALQKMGFTNVYSMDGGIRSWKQANYPLGGN